MKNFKATYIFRGLLFAFLFLILSVYIGREIPWNSSLLKAMYGSFVALAFFAILIHTLYEVDLRTQAEYEELLKGRFLPIRFPGRIAFLIIAVILVHRIWLGGGEMKGIYNQSVTYYKEYDQKTQELHVFYDNMWKTSIQKMNILNLSKETCLELTRTIFENRRDGANVAWKWLQENQPVPYNEFTKFYSNLSDFIETKRNDYTAIEIERQQIAQAHNILISTFPNNLYNGLLNRKPIVYEYGFLSDSTNSVFSSKREDLK